jgi:outer membrane lipoprotein-sorting protein
MIRLITGLFCLLIALSNPAFAQKDPRAQTILDAMSQKYKALKSYQAAFTYASSGANAKGDITVSGNKFRLKLDDQDVFTDGKTMYSYSKEAKEINVQDYESGSTSELNPAQIYNVYQKGYSYRYISEQKQSGRTIDVIELKPTTAKSTISAVRLSIDKANKLIRSWTITDKNGKRTVYTITKFTPNAPAPDALFTFDKSKYPGVEVVDLR